MEGPASVGTDLDKGLGNSDPKSTMFIMYPTFSRSQAIEGIPSGVCQV